MKLLFLFLCLCSVLSVVAQTVVGIEANGPDQATTMAYEWRKPNVYDQYFPQAGFKVLLVNQATRSKVMQALSQNEVTHVTGCGHGSGSQYTGYQMSTIFSTYDPQMLQLLRGKHVHLLSCQTAQMLGPSIIRNGALSYCGYYPNFSFTYKSFGHFMEADAALDKAFCIGKSSKQAYNETIRKFNEKIDILNQIEPEAVRIMVVDRDGLRCMDQQSLTHEEICTCSSMPKNIAQQALFAKNLLSGKFMTYGEYQENSVRALNFKEMDSTTFREMTIASYQNLPADFTVGVVSVGLLTRDQIIAEIQNNSELGNYFIETERCFLTAVTRPMWEHFLNITTDENGNFSFSGTFDAPTGLVRGVQLRWRGGVETFAKAQFQFNNDSYPIDKPLKYEEYSIWAKVATKSNSFQISAEGGPANMEVEVVLADCGCGK